VHTKFAAAVVAGDKRTVLPRRLRSGMVGDNARMLDLIVQPLGA